MSVNVDCCISCASHHHGSVGALEWWGLMEQQSGGWVFSHPLQLIKPPTVDDWVDGFSSNEFIHCSLYPCRLVTVTGNRESVCKAFAAIGKKIEQVGGICVCVCVCWGGGALCVCGCDCSGCVGWGGGGAWMCMYCEWKEGSVTIGGELWLYTSIEYLCVCMCTSATEPLWRQLLE